MRTIILRPMSFIDEECRQFVYDTVIKEKDTGLIVLPSYVDLVAVVGDDTDSYLVEFCEDRRDNG